MKKITLLNSLFISFIILNTLSAQDAIQNIDTIMEDFQSRSPIFDYSEKQLNNTDTIPEFTSQANKIKITGTIYKSDGVTPAENVLLFINQANERGNFELKRHNKKRYVYHRGWVKTDADGRYTFYTFIPGDYYYANELKRIYPIVKAPNETPYKMDALLFDNDEKLRNYCRKRIAKANQNDRILKVEEKDGMFVAQKDIFLDTPIR